MAAPELEEERGDVDMAAEKDADGVSSRSDDDDVDDDSDVDSDVDSDEDSAGSDDDVDGDEVALPDDETMTAIMRLERAVEENPVHYEAHDALVQLLRACAVFKRRLRAAREAMAARFPLNEQRWREWIADEVRASRGKPGRRAKVVGALFERAVNDYVSVPLWLGYAEFSLDQGWDAGARRVLYERAVAVAGQHFTEGHKVWAAYRAFELSRLETARRAAEDKREKATEEAEREAEEAVRRVMRRQLETPHAQLDDTVAMYEAWEKALPPRSWPRKPPMNYAKSAAATAARRPYEDALCAAASQPAALSKAYRAYVAFEEASDDKRLTNVQCVYERAVKDIPNDPALWARYTSYLDHVVNVRSVSAAAHARAVRNCPTHGDTWANAIRAAEHRVQSGGPSEGDDPTSALLEAALGAGLAEGDDYLAVFLARLDVLRRAVDVEGFRATAQLARETLSEMFPEWIDRELLLPSYCADVELTLAGDPDAARELWRSYTNVETASGGARSGGELAHVAEAHVAHAEFLARRIGDVEAARGVFKRSHARCGLVSVADLTNKGKEGIADGRDVVCRAWLRMEREAGTAASYAAADAKAGSRVRASDAEAAEKRVLTPEEARRMRQANDPNFRQGGGKAAREGEGRRVKRKASDGDGGDEEAADEPSAKRPRGGTGRRKEEGVETAAAGTEAGADTLPTEPQARAAKYKEYYPDRDQRTAFVKNLPFKCTEDELAALFDARGGSVTARIVRDKATGKSRGFAYVEFSEEAALQVAIMRDGEQFKGRALVIARSMPPGAGKVGGGGGTIGDKKAGSGGGGTQRRGPMGLGFAGMTPRAARVRVTGGAPSEATVPPAQVKAAASTESGGGDKPKSNADFRAMFLSGFKKGGNLE